MTPKKTILLYPDHPAGALKATVVGSFMRHRQILYVIRPGYDAQGRRRTGWTQIVHDGVPIWEHKLKAPVSKVLAHFDSLWKEAIGQNRKLAEEALKGVKQARMRVYRDGLSGVEPAPALTRDGRDEGLNVPA